MESHIRCSRSTAIWIAISWVLTMAVVGLIVAVVKIQTSEPGSTSADNWVNNYRIPRDTLPVHYDLYLHPNLQHGDFDGKVYIHIDVRRHRDYLVVHAKDLAITKSELHQGYLTMDPFEDARASSLVPKTKSFLYPENEFWVMTSTAGFGPGKFTWVLSFNGNLTKNIVGFYRSVYKNSQGVDRYIATSKFQPTYARRAFPCFDEPSFKSTFKVMLVRPTNDYIALSNMNVEREVEGKPATGMTTVFFKTSVKMVTYLACFIVCDFSNKTLSTNDGVPFSVYARPDEVDAVDYSLQLGTNISNFFVDYFNVPYPLPKQDMIAIPDFVSGAMEHWGLITFREVNLLYKRQTSSAANKQRVATIVSHELAHMWFGNLVTLEWWDDLWLNEGFASYMEYKGVAAFEPTWDMEAQFIASDLATVMELDSRLSSHPIVQEVHHPDEITSLFDTISYNKGAAVLRMLEHFMTPATFIRGISEFLRKYEFGNAVTLDLWGSLQKVWTDNHGLSVTDIMDTWTKQMGYPVVRVRRLDGHFELTQKRFLADPQAKPKNTSPYNYLWDVPISYRTLDANNWKDSNTWLLRNQKNIQIPRGQGVDWIKVNNDYMGYYAVNYDEDVWNIFASMMQNDAQRSKFTPSDRANLIADAFKLAAAAQLNYSIPFEFAKSLRKETHAVPWEIGYYALENIRLLLASSPTSSALENFLQDVSKGLYATLGFTEIGNDDVLKVQLQDKIIRMACNSKYAQCLQDARQKFETWIADPSVTSLSPNLRTSIFKYGMDASMTMETWNKMLDRYILETDAQKKRDYLLGLACAPNESILKRYIEVAKNPSIVRQQDFFTVIAAISRNPKGTDLAWDFYRNEWTTYLVPRFTLNDRYLGNLIKSVTQNFATAERIQEMEMFFKENPEVGAGASARKDALESARNRMLWVERSQEEIDRWLSAS